MDIKNVYYKSLKVLAVISVLVGIGFIIFIITSNDPYIGFFIIPVIFFWLLAIYWYVISQLLPKVDSRQTSLQSFFYYLLLLLSMLPVIIIDFYLFFIIAVLILFFWYKNSSSMKEDNSEQSYSDWKIVYNNEIIAKLIYGEMEDMFWVSYKIVPTDEKYSHTLSTVKLWNDFRFKNESGQYAECVILSIENVTEVDINKRVKLRGLYPKLK